MLVYNEHLLPFLLMVTDSEMAISLKCVVTFERSLHLSEIKLSVYQIT